MIRSLPILLFLGIALFGCHTEVIKEPRPVDVVLGKINGTWQIDVVRLDGVEQVSYKDFTITFSGKENDDLIYFTTAGRPDGCDLPESGSFKLGPNIETDFLVQPEGWNISYWAQASQLEMTFIASQQHNKKQEGEGFILPIPSWYFTMKR